MHKLSGLGTGYPILEKLGSVTRLKQTKEQVENSIRLFGGFSFALANYQDERIYLSGGEGPFDSTFELDSDDVGKIVHYFDLGDF